MGSPRAGSLRGSCALRFTHSHWLETQPKEPFLSGLRHDLTQKALFFNQQMGTKNFEAVTALMCVGRGLHNPPEGAAWRSHNPAPALPRAAPHGRPVPPGAGFSQPGPSGRGGPRGGPGPGGRAVPGALPGAAAAATMSCAALLALRGPRLLRAARPPRWSRRRSGGCEPPAGAAVRIGCASGFWGDTAAAGRRRGEPGGRSRGKGAGPGGSARS